MILRTQNGSLGACFRSMWVASSMAALVCTAPALAQQSLPPQKEYFIGEGQVDLHRGTFLYSNTDLSVRPADPAGRIDLTRYYGVRDGSVGPFGSGAGHNLEVRIHREKFFEEPNGPGRPSYRYHVVIGRSIEVFYKPYAEFGNPPITYYDGSGGYHVLSEASQTGPFTYYGPDGVVITFGSLVTGCPATGIPSFDCAVATTLTKADGSTLNFAYDNTTRLRQVSNNFGYAIGLEYGSKGIAKACSVNLALDYVTTTSPCPAGALAATYTYATDNSYRLLTYTDPSGQTTSYGYDLSINSIQSPGSSAPDVTISYYPNSGKVATQTFANGSTWTYHYQLENDFWSEIPENQWTEVTNPAGKTVRYVFLNGGSRPDKIRDELGRETLFTYTIVGAKQVAQRETAPEGNYTNYAYTGVLPQPTQIRRVAKPGSGLTDIVTSATYPATNCANPKICEKPLSGTDARGAITNFAYDPNHGGVLSEMKPPPTAGGARPLKLTSWAQRYAYVKNASGLLVQAATPVWVVTSETECQTVAGGSTPVCDGSAPSRVTTLEYSSGAAVNALLPRGRVVTADGTSRRTCFGYDNLGRKISETTPNANLTSCP